jgi:hypothetical protein
MRAQAPYLLVVDRLRAGPEDALDRLYGVGERAGRDAAAAAGAPSSPRNWNSSSQRRAASSLPTQ